VAADESTLDRLRALIVDVPDFPRAGIMFRDITALLGDAAALHDTAMLMAAPYRETGVAVVAGIESRGFILGGIVADILGAGFVPVRKSGRLPRATLSVSYELEYGEAVLEVHADAMARGQRTLIVDDLLATGGTAAAAAALVERAGGAVVGLSFLIELAGLHGAARLRSPHSALLVM